MLLTIAFSTDFKTNAAAPLKGLTEPTVVVRGDNATFSRMKGQKIALGSSYLTTHFPKVHFFAIPHATHRYTGPESVPTMNARTPLANLLARFASDQTPNLIFDALVPDGTRMALLNPLHVTIFRSLDHLKHFVPTQG
jgi:hypothetical protein